MIHIKSGAVKGQRDERDGCESDFHSGFRIAVNQLYWLAKSARAGTEIVVHKPDKPNTVVDLFDAYSLTRKRGPEINFLFVDADSSAAGDQSCPIVKRMSTR